jgi:hypothetical protein
VNLSKRENIALVICAVFLSATLFIFFFLIPSQEEISKLNRMIAKRETEVEEIRRLQNEFLTVKRRLTSIGKKISSPGKSFSGLTYAEAIAQRSNVREYIKSITPQAPIEAGSFKGTTMEIKMENVGLEQLVNYVYHIENSEYWMKVNQFVLKNRYGSPGMFDARFVIVSFATG